MSARSPLTIFIPHCSDLLTDHRPHGDGLISYALISRLAERGHQLYIAASRTDLQKPLAPNARLFDLKKTEDDGIASRLNYMRQVRRLFFSLKQKDVRFDLIHQLNPVFTGLSIALVGSKLPLLLGPFFSRWPDDPTALSASNSWRSPLLEKGRTITAFLQQRLADCLLPTTQAAYGQIVLGPRPKTRVEILPIGIDSEVFRPGDSSDSCPSNDGVSGPVTVLFLANVIRRKGIFELLRAFNRVVERCPQAQLLVAGDGSELAEAQSIASGMRGHSRVQFLGRQSRAAAVALFQKAHIYCLPSHGEPYGMTAVEAMSCGKPLVVTDAGGLGYLVDDNGALRVPVGDSERLADALITLIADPARRRAMGEHNRCRVLETMTWDRVTDRLEDIYFATLEGKSSERRQPVAPAARPAIYPNDCT
jgi:glycosyltransferase involved in cell wall biosynthesis